MVKLQIIRLLITLAFTQIWITSLVNSANILGLFAYPGRSHFMVLKTIMVELARRGNNVTVVSNFRTENKLENYKELVIEPPFDYWTSVKDHLGKDELFDMKDLSTADIFEMMNVIGFTTTDYFLGNAHIQNLIKNPNENFDLIIVEQFYQDAVLMMATEYNVPVVAISTASMENHMSSMMGLIIPWAHSPQDFLPYSDKMNFEERLHNFYSSLYSEYNRKYKYFPQQFSLVKKYFSHLTEPLPTMEELQKKVSVLLVNNYVPLDIAKPTVMGVVSIGGVHIPPPKTISWDIKRFLDDAAYGVIYFSLGTNLKSSDIPQKQLEIILKVFSKLRQRILWKWEDENLPNLPSNVLIKKWVPQSDILAHPHVKYFITHGGLLSLQEALFRNVPLLGIPIYGDQHINMKKVSDLGIGIMLDYSNITEISLNWAIHELVTNPSYIIKMRETSRIFRDRPVGAMETAIYWIDYVIRYNGANHIKTAAIDLPWYSLYLVDIILFLIVMFSLFLTFLIFVTCLVIYLRKKGKLKKMSKKLSSKDF